MHVIQNFKICSTRAESARRASIFAANVAKIVAHNERYNRGEETFSKGINQFTDMTEREFLEHINGNPIAGHLLNFMPVATSQSSQLS